MVSRLTPEYAAPSATANQVFMVPSARARTSSGAEIIVGCVTRSSASTKLAGALLHRADEGILPTSGRGSIAPHGVGDDSGIAF